MVVYWSAINSGILLLVLIKSCAGTWLYLASFALPCLRSFTSLAAVWRCEYDEPQKCKKTALGQTNVNVEIVFRYALKSKILDCKEFVIFFPFYSGR